MQLDHPNVMVSAGSHADTRKVGTKPLPGRDKSLHALDRYPELKTIWIEL